MSLDQLKQEMFNLQVELNLKRIEIELQLAALNNHIKKEN